jgi:hypothetical protein
MADFKYNQTIEYIDGTRDLNFEAARKWAAEHGTSFEEDESRREKTAGKLKRYFIIGAEPEKPAPIEPQPEPEPTQEEKEQIARNERNMKLTFTDWTQLPDAPLTAETKAAWAAYRQALRDVPEQAGFPYVIEWPEQP